MREVREKKREVICLAFLVLLDQLTKLFVKKFGFYSINKGISWGLSFCPIFPIFIIFLLMALLYKRRTCFGFWLIVAGGISNLMDRLIYGGVVDFIAVPFFPSFNLADVFISLGIILAFVDMIKEKRV